MTSSHVFPSLSLSLVSDDTLTNAALDYWKEKLLGERQSVQNPKPFQQEENCETSIPIVRRFFKSVDFNEDTVSLSLSGWKLSLLFSGLLSLTWELSLILELDRSRERGESSCEMHQHQDKELSLRTPSMLVIKLNVCSKQLPTFSLCVYLVTFLSWKKETKKTFSCGEMWWNLSEDRKESRRGCWEMSVCRLMEWNGVPTFNLLPSASILERIKREAIECRFWHLFSSLLLPLLPRHILIRSKKKFPSLWGRTAQHGR